MRSCKQKFDQRSRFCTKCTVQTVTKLDPVRKVLRIFHGFRLGTISVLLILQTVRSLSLKNRLEVSTGIYFSFEINEFPIVKKLTH
jgi:hypothetical protein